MAGASEVEIDGNENIEDEDEDEDEKEEENTHDSTAQDHFLSRDGTKWSKIPSSSSIA